MLDLLVNRIKLLLHIKIKCDIGNKTVILSNKFQWKRFYCPV